MKKYSFKLLLLFSLLLAGILLLNFRYPFITKKVGKWSVGYNFTKDPFKSLELAGGNVISYNRIDSLLNTKKSYIADPFFIRRKDTFYLFVELKAEKDADIALFISPDGLNYKYKGIVLDEAFHLSYPQVFSYKGEYFMLPETKESGNVLLYKAEAFPYSWKIEDTLLKDRVLKDPTLLLSADLNLLVAADDDMNQLMFESDSLKGKWEISKRFSGRKGNETRPGGRFFQYKEDWYLPVQDRRYGYGSGVSLYKLYSSKEEIKLEVSKERYLKGYDSLPWFNRGMHHLDIQKTGDTYYAVYDGDRNTNGENVFQVKRTLKYNLYDIFN